MSVASHFVNMYFFVCLLKNGKSESFDVKFYHALAAVKFVLETDFDGDGQQDKTTSGAIDFHGADIHSVTLCYTDDSGNIITTGGIATKGTCTASPKDGSDGSREVDFSWPKTSLTNRKPMHFVFNDGTSSTTKVSGGYANTGDGVLFMIPQTATGLKVIVEFSKYGGTEYFTKVITKGLDIEWKAGYCYTYKFKIGEFHVPGELLSGSGTLTVSGFQNGNYDKLFDTPLKTKGVTNIGLIVSEFTYKDNGNGAAVMSGAPNNGNPEASISKSGSNFIVSPSSPTTIQVDFLPIITNGTIGSSVTKFGNGTTEDYDSYQFVSVSKTTTFKGPFYYVFNMTGCNTYNIAVYGYSNSNNAKITYEISSVIVLKVETDPNLPSNFNTIDWSAI